MSGNLIFNDTFMQMDGKASTVSKPILRSHTFVSQSKYCLSEGWASLDVRVSTISLRLSAAELSILWMAT